MYWRIAAALILATFLAATHWKAYVSGKQTVQAEWTQKSLEAERNARAREQELLAAKQKAEEAYVEQKRKAAVAAAGAKSELDRLRDALAARGDATQDPSAQPRADGGTRLELELLGSCAAALTQLAAEADRLEALVVGLQGYIKSTVIKSPKP
jgi:hypothetical protein